MSAPELVIVAAQLWLPAPTNSTALAVSEGKIIAVGTDEEIHRLVGPATEVIDVGGNAVVPGFHDAHVHAQAGGLGLLGCDLSDLHNLTDYENKIAEYAEHHTGDWVVGSGWFGDVFTGGFPDKGILDHLVPDRPAVFTSHDAHGLWVNTRALQIAGIDRETPEPHAGNIQRDGDGEPTGMLFETAGELVTRHMPAHDAVEMRKALLAAQEFFFSLGITAWHDAILGDYLTLPDSLPAYLSTLSDGSLKAWVTGSIWWPPEFGFDRIDEVRERVAAARAEGFEVGSVKIMQDGICENCTAALLAPYTDVHPETSGTSVIDPVELKKIVAALDREGLSVHFHGVGDRAVRECLDAVEFTRKQNGNGQKHQIAHLDLVDPADFDRFAELGVTANLQPLWARDDQEILQRKYPRLGAERRRWHFPFGSLNKAGAHLAMGSDWPVTSPDPLWGLHTACNRTAPTADVHALNEESRQTAQPEERLDVETALRAYTLGAAEISGNADDIGSLDVGKSADLVLLSGPIGDPRDFDRVHVARTVLRGITVFSSDTISEFQPSERP